MSIIESKFPNAQHYIESWMLVKKNEATIFKSSKARKLCGLEDAKKLRMLFSTREDRPGRNLNKYLNWISRMPVYEVFIDNELVSYAGSFLQLLQIWMIGGVYTHPNLSE